MVTARYLTDKFVRPLIEQYREEGREEGIEVGEARANRKWETWYRNRIEAENRGIPFDEPPPSSHSGMSTNGRQANPIAPLPSYSV